MSLRLKMPRSIAWLALFGFLSSTGLPLYESHGLGAADDAACVTAGEKSGRDVMSAPGADDAPKHCAVCHLLRAVNGSVTPGTVALTVPAELSAASGRPLDLLVATDHSVRASRAPPSTL